MPPLRRPIGVPSHERECHGSGQSKPGRPSDGEAKWTWGAAITQSSLSHHSVITQILVLFSLCAHISGTMTPFSHISADAGDSADGGVTLILVLLSLCARISGTMTPFAPETIKRSWP